MKPRIEITNTDKVLYSGGRFTKAQVIDYYRRIAPVLLPHFRNRPVTLKRFPDGVHGDFFYEKDAPTFTPKWIKTFPVPRHEGGPPINYILINDVETLVWCANIAAVELHPFLHRVPKIETPTAVVFDLDPGEGVDLLGCAEVALLLRELLAPLRLKCFAKVSGSKGMQVYVPLNSETTYEATQSFARAVAELLERQHPDQIVADMAKNLRLGKVFIDWSQNADHKTTVGVYSLRAKRNRPFVSVPVKWSELERSLKTKSADSLFWTADQALLRVKKVGDLFALILKLKQKLPEAFGNSERKSMARRSVPPLAEYGRKRHFNKTAEPKPNFPRRSRQGGRRRFVVQKHAASQLHYDFRLEMHDVLKSWAVPRGLPLQLNERHSAFATEDHPIDYLSFEGIIPEGEYGGGTVMVWDIGSYDIVDGNYWKGALTVFLQGKKLRGEWKLQRTESENGKTRWLLTKSGQNEKRIPAKQLDRSALTGRTMEQIAQEKSAVWQRHDGADARARRSISGIGAKPARGRGSSKVRARAPGFVSPMKATSVEKLPTGEEWLYEIKWDGYRALALKHGETVRLLSAKEKSLASDFPTVVSDVRELNADTAVLDGEVVAINERGKPSFQILQNRKSLGREWRIVYYAFDLLNLEGKDLRSLPLCDRKEKLRELVASSRVRYSAELEGNAGEVVAAIEKAGLEGIVAKRRNSRYQARTRSRDWVKLKLGCVQEFVIGGYNPDPPTFQSLLVGYYEKGKLMFAGKVRQGFNPASRAKLFRQLHRLGTSKCPFTNLPCSQKSHFGEGITADDMQQLKWLRPKLLAQVQFTEWTSYGLLRHATFLALRDDKNPHEVVRETAK